MAAGWTKLDGYWYYFNNEGKLMTGWMQLDGSSIISTPTGAWSSDGRVTERNKVLHGYGIRCDVGWLEADRTELVLL